MGPSSEEYPASEEASSRRCFNLGLPGKGLSHPLTLENTSGNWRLVLGESAEPTADETPPSELHVGFPLSCGFLLLPNNLQIPAGFGLFVMGEGPYLEVRFKIGLYRRSSS